MQIIPGVFRFLLPAFLVIAMTPALSRTEPQVVISTSKGDITLQLFSEKAPATVANFLQYVDEGFFTDTIFHRVIPGFMIQGGGMTLQMESKATRSPVRNEADNGLGNRRGTLAMARTNDPDSATSQFFINLVDNSSLNARPGNAGYAVFGKVASGMEIVDTIAAVPTGTRPPHGDVPTEAIVITGVSRVQEDQE